MAMMRPSPEAVALSFSQHKTPSQDGVKAHEVAMATKSTERVNFGKIKEVIAPPNLIEIQLDSYEEFLQTDVSPSKRKNLGLQAVFTEVFPIESYDGKTVLDFHSYDIQPPKIDWLECLREGLTFGAPLYVTFQLKQDKIGRAHV